MKFYIAIILAVLAIQLNASPDFNQDVSNLNAIREILCVRRLIIEAEQVIRNEVEWFREVSRRFDRIEELRANCQRLPPSLVQGCLEANDTMRQLNIARLLAELVHKARHVPQDINRVINNFENCRNRR